MGVFNRTINPLVIVGYEMIIECFYMTSRRPHWCPKTMKRRPCWCPKPILWELNSFRMQTLSFVPRQDKTRQWFIWSLILSYVYRLYPNNLKLQYICIDDGQGRGGGGGNTLQPTRCYVPRWLLTSHIQRALVE